MPIESDKPLAAKHGISNCLFITTLKRKLSHNGIFTLVEKTHQENRLKNI